DRFLELLRARESSGRRYAILWLGHHRVVAEEEVAACVNDSDAEVRKLAVAYLGEHGGAGFLSRVGAGARDRDWAVRQAVAEALARNRGPGAVPVLMKLLSDTDWRVRETAAVSLQNYPGPETAQALLRLLNDDDPRTVVLAVRALGGLGEPQAAAEIARIASDSNRAVREEAASSLGRLGGATAAQTLIRLLGDESPRVKAAAAKSLGRCGDRGAALALLRLALESNQEVRTSALDSLTSLDPEWTEEEHKEAADLIYSALASPDFRISDYALGQAGKLGDAPLVERLLLMLESGDWRRRGKIVDALGRSRDARAIPALIKLLGVRDPLLGATVPQAILSIGGPETAPLLLEALPEAGENK
nr:HEAT repeat domain-containing protein [bacterium]